MTKNNKTVWIVWGLILSMVVSTLIFYLVTYNHPIMTGDPELGEKYREVCLQYSHDLMMDFLGIPAHAQIINVRQDGGEIIILLTSFIPPSRTKVWHSDGDIPYWEMGARSYS